MKTESRELRCSVELDPVSVELASAFDYRFTGESLFVIPKMPEPPEGFRLGLIVGGSGTGKSSLLRSFGEEEPVQWDRERSIAAHFRDADEARDRLSGVGLNSVPAWMRPRHVLSTGEGYRADLARRLRSGAVVDEFTSVVDRNVAASLSTALRRYVDRADLRGVVVASCHRDIAEWLLPDWVFDTETGAMLPRGAQRRPSIELSIDPCDPGEWAAFRAHHYLSADMNAAAHCWLVRWNGARVAFCASLPFPRNGLVNAWREHRTVVLPEFQGMGIGSAVSDAIARLHITAGRRYFSKTASYALASHRERSDEWRATTKNRKARGDYMRGNRKFRNIEAHAGRVCWSHEFVGEPFAERETAEATRRQIGLFDCLGDSKKEVGL